MSADPAYSEPPAGTRPVRVLVAEDNPVSRKLVVRLLQKHDFEVTAVEDGTDAVAAITAAIGGTGPAVDVMLMDVEMPEMDGLSAARAIRALDADLARTVPIVALTAHNTADVQAQCVVAGMTACLTKPLVAADLFATIETLVGGARGSQNAGDTP